MKWQTLAAVGFGCVLWGCERPMPNESSSASVESSAEPGTITQELLADGGWAPVGVYGPGGSLSGWDIYDADPVGATMSVVTDSVRGNVNQFTSQGVDNGFRLRKANLQPWGNTANFNLSWWHQFSAAFTIYVDVNTSGGQRYLTYTASAASPLGDAGYVIHGLGPSAIDGTWRQFQRDLKADLAAAQPALTMLSVNAFLIRGTGKVDDITLQAAPFSPPTITAFYANATDVLWGSAVGLVVNATPALPGDALTYQWTATAGTLANANTNRPTWTAPNADATAVVSVVVKGPNNLSVQRNLTIASRQTGITGNTYTTGDSLQGWSVYDNDPPGALARIVPSGTARGNVIELVRPGDNGFMFSFPTANTKNFTITWDMLFTVSSVVYVDVMTTAGQRYLTYIAGTVSQMGSGQYVVFALGPAFANGQWLTVTRDLQADFRQAQPEHSVLSVRAVLIRGTGMVDTIRLGAPVCQ